MKRPLAVRSEGNLYAEAGGEVKKASHGGEPSASQFLTKVGYAQVLTTAGYAVRPSNNTQELGHFLKQCNYSNCQKQIAKDANVFMYGDFGAYCSVECREHQIEVDKKAKASKSISNSKTVK